MEAKEKDRWQRYFQRHLELDGRPLPLMPKPCKDCPVVHGMYLDISDALKHQEEPIKRDASLSWFCHSNPKRACRGNYDNVYPKEDK